MDNKRLRHLLHNPSAIKKEDYHNLQQLTKRYPYFQAAYILMARYAQDQSRADQEPLVQQASLHVPDRQRFYEFLQADQSSRKKKEKPQSREPKKSTAPSTEQPSQPSNKKSPGKDKKEETASSGKVSKKEEASREKRIPKASSTDSPPQQQDSSSASTSSTSEKKSFAGWLSQFSESRKTASSRSSFHQPEPKLKKSQADRMNLAMPQTEEGKEALEEMASPTEDIPSAKEMAKSSVEQNDNIVSETLAKIYAQQRNYKKAIEIYKKLRLRYPEKNRYFDEKIAELKEQRK